MKTSVLWTACQLLLGVFAREELDTKASTQQILTGDFKPAPVFENVNLVRNTNLEKGYVRETINIVVKNIDTSPQSEYYVPFEYDVVGKIGGFEVRDKKSAAKGPFRITQAALAGSLSANGTAINPTQYLIAHLPEPLKPQEQVTISISYHILSALVPLPAAIKQEARQYLTYSFSAYWPSVYPTLKQKTKLKLPTSDVPEYTQTTGLTSTKDPEVQGSSVTYGTYDTSKVPAGTTHPVTVRYDYTKPVLVSTVLERDLEVSHWGGNLATEERYWLRNDGATLIDNFDRVKWAIQNYQAQAPVAALRELRIPLKPGSVDPYFTDDIGNVSTSRFRPNNVREALLEIKPRYPLFGGWKYSFRIGWDNNLKSFVRKLKTSSDSYVLAVPLLEGPKMTEGIAYEHVTIRVILPEGAKNVRWETHGGSGVPMLTAELSLHKTFMDTVGRTELKLTGMNLVDEARDITLLVSYDYPFFAAFRKPVTFVTGAAAVFVVAYLIGQVDTSIGGKKKA